MKARVARLRELLLRVKEARQLSPAEVTAVRRASKWGAHRRRLGGSHAERDEEYRLTTLDALITKYEQELARRGVVPERTEHRAGVTVESSPDDSAPAEVPGDPSRSNDSHDIYRDPTAPVNDMPWVSTLDVARLASVGTPIGWVSEPRSVIDARVRVVLLAPIRNGALSVEDGAAAWRDAFANAPHAVLREEAVILPADVRRRYRRLSARTMRRWLARVKDAPDTPSGSLSQTECLRQVPSRRRAAWKATPELVARATELFLANPSWSAANVAWHLKDVLGYDVALRTIQRVISTAVPDRTRALERGGPAAEDELFRMRLLREVPYPNRCWIMDHSFVRQELRVSPQAAEVRNVDFEILCRREAADDTKVVRTLCMTVILDACTRLPLACRLWDRPPNTRLTLVALFEAICQYGVPEILYTDNGSDLRSHLLSSALTDIGIHQVFSRPYTPQGRGKIERYFQTIKHAVFPHLPGFQGGHLPKAWHPDDLLTRAQLQAHVWSHIDVQRTTRVHGETRRIPFEHYNAEVGARRFLSGMQQGEALDLLQSRLDVPRRRDGLHVHGRVYWSPDLDQLAEDVKCCVHWDPDYADVVHVGVRDAHGRKIYVTAAQAYDPESPPPTFVEQQRLEATRRGLLPPPRGAVHSRLALPTSSQTKSPGVEEAGLPTKVAARQRRAVEAFDALAALELDVDSPAKPATEVGGPVASLASSPDSTRQATPVIRPPWEESR